MSVGPATDPPGQDAGPIDHEVEEASGAARPVRRVDDDRWQASWDRFQAAHDEEAARRAELSGDPPSQPDETDAPSDPPVAEDPSASPEAPAPPPAAREPRHHRAEQTQTQTQTQPQPQTESQTETQPQTQAPAAVVSASELTSQTLLRQRKETSARGWRRLLHRASGGSVNRGLSSAERRQRDRVQLIMTPVQGCHRVAVVSLKGGVGKTTTTACLGLTLAHHRGDRMVAMDANPDSGTLAERLAGTAATNVSDLMAHLAEIRTFTDVAAYTSLAERLQVLGFDQDPLTVRPFDEVSYRAADEVLSRFFNIVLVDSGTGVLHSAMTGTLAMADSLVVVAGPTVDGAGRAARTLDWLVAHGYGGLVERSVAVVCSQRPDSGEVDLAMLRNHFGARCREVVEIPFDPHLATGGRIERSRLRPQTADAFTTAAAAVAEGFAPPT